jgi:N-acetylglucosaminyldiphosphoundecaprenol N-acetyl-beta-D-mannosaminyltransferase
VLRDALVARYPGLQIVGIATPPHGTWPDDVSLDLADQVRRSGAQILWIGVSAPKQEIWARRYLAQTGVPTVCVGAAFDFLSGSMRRAPSWMRKRGLEWLYRLLSDPRRLWKRYLIGNLRFLIDLAHFRSKPPSHRAP